MKYRPTTPRNYRAASGDLPVNGLIDIDTSQSDGDLFNRLLTYMAGERIANTRLISKT
ncbi:MAG: hypothetical protein IT525_06655 [Nitrosomonas sp.]|nr:hypothetical protein [Nitrosomonas sp.]